MLQLYVIYPALLSAVANLGFIQVVKPDISGWKYLTPQLVHTDNATHAAETALLLVRSAPVDPATASAPVAETVPATTVADREQRSLCSYFAIDLTIVSTAATSAETALSPALSDRAVATAVSDHPAAVPATPVVVG